MDSKDIKTVIDVDKELELSSKVANHTAADSKNDGGPRLHEAGSRSNNDKTRDGTRAETDGAPLLLKTVVEQDPGDSTARGSQVGHVTCHHCANVHGEGRATVEAEPADPEEDRAENDVGYIMRTVGKTVVVVVASALAEHEGVGQGACS